MKKYSLKFAEPMTYNFKSLAISKSYWLLAFAFAFIFVFVFAGCNQDRYQPAQWRSRPDAGSTTLPGTGQAGQLPGTTLPGTTLPGTTLPVLQGTTLPGTTLPSTRY